MTTSSRAPTVDVAKVPSTGAKATMRAAVLHDFDTPLTFERRPVPRPGRGEVIVRVEACGLCHNDLHTVRGDWEPRPKLPVVPGHEVVGRVTAVGAGVLHLFHGSRVAVPSLGWACGRCSYCLSGDEALCPERRNTGYDIDGGFAEYVKADADFVVSVPAGVDPLDAACLSCAGVSTYRAVKSAGVGLSDVTAVFGIGGLGHLAVQYARLSGAAVVAVDTRADKLAMARDLGARLTVDVTSDDPVEAICEMGGANQAIVAVGSSQAISQALESLRPGGTAILLAMPPDTTVALRVDDAVRRGITVVGSIGGSRVDLARVLALHAEGHTRVVHQARALDQVNSALSELETDNVPARLVFDSRW